MAEFDILYNKGISREGDILDLAARYEFIRKAGAFYSYGETKLGQGRENSKAFLEQNEKITKELEKLIRQHCSEATASAISPTASREAAKTPPLREAELQKNRRVSDSA